MRNFKMKRLIILISSILLATNLYAADITTTTCPGAGCVDLPVANQGSIGIQVTGTWVGTITFQGTVDNTNFAPVSVISSADTTGARVTTTTGNGLYQTTIAGLTKVRVVFTSWMSGTATVTLRSTQVAGKFGTGGSGTSGTVTSIATTSPITGGTITSTGTIACATCATATSTTTFTNKRITKRVTTAADATSDSF